MEEGKEDWGERQALNWNVTGLVSSEPNTDSDGDEDNVVIVSLSIIATVPMSKSNWHMQWAQWLGSFQEGAAEK